MYNYERLDVYKRGYTDKEKLLQWLQDILDDKQSSVDFGEELLIDFVYCCAQDLYQAGLPEWIEWIDEYTPGLDDDAGWKGVAILVDPSSHQLDKNGYYDGRDGLAMMESLTGKILRDEAEVKNMATAAKAGIKIFLAIRELFQALSDVLGFNIMEDIDSSYKILEASIKLYNEAVKPGTWPTKFFPEEWKLSAISLAKLKPDKRETEHLRERMAVSFGDNWWKSGEIKDIREDIRLALRDMIKDTWLLDEVIQEGEDGQEA